MNGVGHGQHALLTVDLVVLTVRDDQLQVVLIERGKDPFRGRLALPGGFVRSNEDIDEAAVRELAEEAGLDGRQLHLEQLRTYATPGRDPRGRVASVAYLALAPDLPIPVAGTDARNARWAPIDSVIDRPNALAFDHDRILADGVERARAKLEYTTLATAFCLPTFTISDLRRVYEVVWSTTIDARNFHRKVVNAENFLAPTGGKRASEVGRPAALYRAGGATVLYPPMLRSSAAHAGDVAG
ncbi:NUDIX hydrolase [Verrucosispora sp. WMMD703]|uniref:NUDIX hydrolase n=1 Tax=Micromonospora TaxID=1873 RepID=UPI0037937911